MEVMLQGDDFDIIF